MRHSVMNQTARLGIVGLMLTGTIAMSCNSGRADPAGDALARGVAAQNAGKPEDAKKAYFETLAADPRNLLAFHNLGQLYRVAYSKPAIAAGYYLQALEVNPDYAPSLFGLAYVQAQQDLVKESIALYRKVITIDANNAAAHYNLGLLLRISGSIAEGDAEVARGRQLDPSLAAPGPVITPAPPSSSSPRPSPTR